MTIGKTFTVTGLTLLAGSILVGFLLLSRGVVVAASDNACGQLPSYADLKAALTTARLASNGGFNLDMWGSIVNRDGVVCAVAFTGADRGSEWPGSRVISAQKANTANSFSLPGLALSTANLWAAFTASRLAVHFSESPCSPGSAMPRRSPWWH